MSVKHAPDLILELHAVVHHLGLDPKINKKKTDIFLSVYGVMHVIVGSRKSEGKENMYKESDV